MDFALASERALKTPYKEHLLQKRGCASQWSLAGDRGGLLLLFIGLEVFPLDLSVANHGP